MNYIVVLNWNSAKETIACISSLISLNGYENNKIIICDNDSKIDSYNAILDYLLSKFNNDFLELKEDDISNQDFKYRFYLIRNKKNYGYAGGNNVGIRFALNSKDMKYVWVLNNDTVVDKEALNEMILKFEQKESLGICGSRLIDYYDKNTVQSVGGVINTWTCLTYPVGANLKINDLIDESYIEEKIDFVVGASLLFSRDFLEKVGLLCEDYFLYYEEIDICNRAKANGFDVGVASKSFVYHIEGGSTVKEISDLSDYLSVKNRILVSRKFYKNKLIFVKLSLIMVVFNRVRRGYFKRAFNYIRFFGL